MEDAALSGHPPYFSVGFIIESNELELAEEDNFAYKNKSAIGDINAVCSGMCALMCEQLVFVDFMDLIDAVFVQQADSQRDQFPVSGVLTDDIDSDWLHDMSSFLCTSIIERMFEKVKQNFRSLRIPSTVSILSLISTPNPI